MIDFVREFYAYIRANNKWWLLPIYIILLLIGGLIALSQMSAIGPFIYAVF